MDITSYLLGKKSGNSGTLVEKTLNTETTDDTYEHYNVLYDEANEHTGYPEKWSYDVERQEDYKECSNCHHRKYQTHKHDLEHATSIISCTYREATGKYIVKYICSCGSSKTTTSLTPVPVG